ncbi:Cytochrome oxidase Cu insertion factor, SCO1/SenC/PrrC family [Nitrosospira multiformis]|nr:Cytochrome oxidase Cu insertion factor, SCO1/SenC/PrrC family [Nitrosospira multiformis]
MSNESVTKKNRRTLILLALVLSAPFVASYLLYFWNVRPQTVNYGDLIEVRQLKGTGLNDADRTIFRMRDLRGKWVLMSIDSGACDEQCQKKLYYMRQVRTYQNTEMDRIERLWLIDDEQKPSPEVLSDYEGMHVILAKNSELLKEVPAAGSQHDHIYLIDPIGNLMMRFPKDPDPGKMAKDIKRLLKVSQLEHAMGTDMKH